MSDIIIHVVRHGHIPSHNSDVALTAEGRQAVHLAGRQLAAAINEGEAVGFLHGPALRARQTAWGMYDGLNEGLASTLRVKGPELTTKKDGQPGSPEPVLRQTASGVGVHVSAPMNHPDLRNLGLMVQGRLQEAMRLLYDVVRAEYLANSSLENASRLEFHHRFWAADDPIGYWLTHPCPHAEDPEQVARRIRKLLGQLLAEPPLPPARRRRVICASHSATMRAFLRQVLGADPGEPDFCEGFTVEQVDNRPARVVFRAAVGRL